MIRDALGDRMKHNYEEVFKTKLVHRMPVIIRLDGVAFHTFTKGFDKPFDELFMKAMQNTMKDLCSRIQGCVLGYTQSDEITLVLQDYAALDMQPWYDNEVQKMCSVAASLATLSFNKHFRVEVNQYSSGKVVDTLPRWETYNKAVLKGAIFDARCFNVPKEEVTNCLLWREKDAYRNSVNSLAQSLYSHRELQGINLSDTIEKLRQERGIDWEALPSYKKWGCCCVKDSETGKWYIDTEIPMFVGEDRNYVESRINFEE